jgi:hypothetical protein
VLPSALAVALLWVAPAAAQDAPQLKLCAVVSARTGEVPERAVVKVRRTCLERETELGTVATGNALQCVGRVWTDSSGHVSRTPTSLCQQYEEFCLRVEGADGSCETPAHNFSAICCRRPIVETVDVPAPSPTFVPPSP